MSEERWPPDIYREGASVSFRQATLEDAPVLERWDRDPAVISATTDDANAEKAFGDHDWRKELPKQSEVDFYLIAELNGRPFGAMQIIDPYREPTHYWGEIEPNLRAIDIWIGEPACRGMGLGEHMMQAAMMGCFDDPAVTAIIIDPLNSNARAHQFYQRLGFRPTHRQIFNGEDDCLVHRLTRADWEKAGPADPSAFRFNSGGRQPPASDNDNDSGNQGD
jgi:aminoglycoside 6'-N-acetyltransferase